MEYTVVLKFARNTPRKLRYVADMIRNKPVPQAQQILKFTSKRAAYFLIKLVNSALANATNKDAEVAAENLKISKITVGDGPAFKRFRAASMGRGVVVKKRTSHVTLTLQTIK